MQTSKLTLKPVQGDAGQCGWQLGEEGGAGPAPTAPVLLLRHRPACLRPRRQTPLQV